MTREWLNGADAIGLRHGPGVLGSVDGWSTIDLASVCVSDCALDFMRWVMREKVGKVRS